MPHKILLVFISVSVDNLHCVTCDLGKVSWPPILLLSSGFPLSDPVMWVDKMRLKCRTKMWCRGKVLHKAMNVQCFIGVTDLTKQTLLRSLSKSSLECQIILLKTEICKLCLFYPCPSHSFSSHKFSYYMFYLFFSPCIFYLFPLE